MPNGLPDATQTISGDDPTLQELYPDAPEAVTSQPAPAVDATMAQTEDAQATLAGTPGTATAEQAEAGGFEAQEIEMTPEMMSATQMEQITAKDSPLMQRAKQEGMLTAASRGLQNSTIAAGTAMGAMVDRAMPMALQDAQTTFRGAEINQQAQQEAARFTAENQERINMLNAQLGTDVSKFNAEQLNEAERLNAQMQTAVSQQNAEAYNQAQRQFAELQTRADLENADQIFRSSLQAADASNQINLQRMSQITELNRQYLTGQQALDLASLNNQYQQLISTNEAAASMWSSVFNSMGDILSNKDIDPSRAAQAINQMAKELGGALEFMQAMNGYEFQEGTAYNPIPTPGAPGETPPGSPANPGIPTPGTPEYQDWLNDIIGNIGPIM